MRVGSKTITENIKQTFRNHIMELVGMAKSGELGAREVELNLLPKCVNGECRQSKLLWSKQYRFIPFHYSNNDMVINCKSNCG